MIPKGKVMLALTAILILSAIGAMMLLENNKVGNSKDSGGGMNPGQSPTYRPVYHFSVPDGWKNDPQKPVYYKGEYHYYYLYNKDYPSGNGTEWRHSVSKDLLHWKDAGVAIPKYSDENGDPWSGTVVIDHENTAGYGRDAFIAIVTQPSGDAGRQEQFLWYSTDGGYSFQKGGEHPVLKNPGTNDFRDPKIIWDEERGQWTILLAEGSRIGFYQSPDLKKWTYTGDFQTEDMGVLECPDLFRMRAEDGTVKWILGMSANGEGKGEPHTYAYWTGEFDGRTFQADQDKAQWLDHGFDWYGAVTFGENGSEEPASKRYSFAWMNRWAYADITPTMEADGFNGSDSIIREIQLNIGSRGEYKLFSKPHSSLNRLAEDSAAMENIQVNGEVRKLSPKGEAYRIEAEIDGGNSRNFGFRLRESKDSARHTDAGINLEEGYSYLNRANTDNPDRDNLYQESRALFDGDSRNIQLTILVDRTSVELFVNDGEAVHTHLVFPSPEDIEISIYSEGGEASFRKVKVESLSG
ncbi:MULTISPECIES: glycoside hydrolase family 32 protein [Bacillaceae]|uniref:glycoside hydrolase family 32 protein n=1 Tax=Bacillaceae TaxID=186817 RepID=UPI0029649195|nr:GH32 C-terminal domain-containing protein [Bacillus infantis]MDW2879476.1 GH32 C-terminal domain-containing protein [Bacillus infantis]